MTLPDVVVAASPVPSAPGIDLNKVPGAVTTVTHRDFEERLSPAVTDTLTSHVPGAVAINTDGSDLSPDFFFRGFDVSRLSGIANGLAVYQNGVRINEAFGDGVNLELIPPIAIQSAEVYTNNPVFGLNALGGAINFQLKNGFNFHGGDFTILGGSYGRVNGFGEFGKQVGNYSFYFAGDLLYDGGFRHPSGPSNLERAYADLGYLSTTHDTELHVIGSFGRSFLGVAGVTPEVLVNQRYNSVYTTPQSTNNQAGLAQLTGRFDLTPTLTLSSNFYLRQFDQFHTDGNDADVSGCQPGGPGTATVACLDDDDAPGATDAQRAFRSNGRFIPYLGDNFGYGSTSFTSTHTLSAGTEQQLVSREKVFGHDNYFLIGGSVDRSSTNFQQHTALGELDTNFVDVLGGFPGANSILQTAGDLGYAPVYTHSTNTYYGVFALDTFNITKRLAITGGARFNVADITLRDLTGQQPDLNSSVSYNRINPVVGATYEFAPALTVYAGYSEANRAPTPLENECSNPLLPCVLETALVSDPPLQQVVSHTVEAGARGGFSLPTIGGALNYKAGYFRVENTNDIIQEASAITGQGFFANVPETLRTGAEASINYVKGNWEFYGNYAFVDATYQSTVMLSSPANPFADENGDVTVHPGNHIPGIPRNIGKLGFTYKVTPRLTVGSDITLIGSQYFVGDNANQNPQLPFYYRVDARASYSVTDHVQLLALITNLTNNHYATFGSFYETDTSGTAVNQTLANNVGGDSRALTVAQPFSIYGGVKVTF